MPIYEYQGQQYELSTNDPTEAKQKILSYLGQASQPTPAQESPKEEPSMLNRMFGMGSPTYSLIRGAVVEPALGLNQMLASTGLFGEDIKKGATDIARREAQAAEEARKAQGRGGVDFVNIAGAVVSPVNKLLSTGQAATALGRIGQAAASGGIYASLTPSIGNDPTSEKLVQIGVGATLGGALGGLSEATPILKGLYDKLPVTAKNKDAIFKKYVSDLIPEDKNKLVEELKQVGQFVQGSEPTVAEALSDMPSAYKLVKAQEKLEKTTATAGKFIERRIAQEGARVKALDEVFGSQADLLAAKEARLTSTAPMRERALREANFYGETASKLEAELAKGTTQFGALNPKAKNDLIKAQIENIKANGYYPLTADGLINKIDTMANSPGTRSNEMLNYAVAKLRGKLTEYSDKNGVINSVDLYNIRKEIAQDLSEYAGSKNMATASFRAEATKAETNLKKLLDAEINKAAGSNLWTNYLTNFAEHSKKIDQLELGQQLKDKLQGNFSEETAGKFLQAINEAPATIKRATGTSRYEKLDEVLSPKQVSTVNAVYADLLRAEKAKASGKGVEQAKGADINTAQEVPGFLSTAVTFAKNVLRDLASGTQKDFDNRMAELLLDPKKFSTFLETVPTKQQEEVFKIMSQKMTPSIREQFVKSYSTLPSGQELGRAYSQQSFK